MNTLRTIMTAALLSTAIASTGAIAAIDVDSIDKLGTTAGFKKSVSGSVPAVKLTPALVDVWLDAGFDLTTGNTNTKNAKAAIRALIEEEIRKFGSRDTFHRALHGYIRARSVDVLEIPLTGFTVGNSTWAAPTNPNFTKTIEDLYNTIYFYKDTAYNTSITVSTIAHDVMMSFDQEDFNTFKLSREKILFEDIIQSHCSILYRGYDHYKNDMTVSSSSGVREFEQTGFPLFIKTILPKLLLDADFLKKSFSDHLGTNKAHRQETMKLYILKKKEEHEKTLKKQEDVESDKDLFQSIVCEILKDTK